MPDKKTAIIIGAGPAGLTAAYELLDRTDIKPIIYEMTEDIGGISKTINYKGNRIDIGGHRFFSKSGRVMRWWQNILPSQMLTRTRLSRIFFLRKLFDYPISLNLNTFSNLGFMRIIKIGLSYAKTRFSPIEHEVSLEDFFINRFGKELYLTFFKDYTEKVWGIPCNKIGHEWGRQRIKGLSISKALLHAVKKQKNTETSLIGQFLYPKLGPGQMWEQAAKIIKEKGGEIYLKYEVIGLKYHDNKIVEAVVREKTTNKLITKTADYFFSTMPVKELIQSLQNGVPQEVQRVAQGLIYRDFITVGLLLRKLKIKNKTGIKTINNIIPDNWIYIQERDVKLGRIQIFNNWSPYMVKDENTVWIGLEYFCNEGDELWNKSDEGFAKFAINELAKIDIIEKEDALDSIVIRMPKTYPAYFGAYDQFHVIKNFTDKFENLFLIGRNGMHRYNNQDHSMLTAMTAVENIINNIKFKHNIWAVNTEDEYHEDK